MTEEQLITKLKTLRQISPRKEWVSSVRMQVLSSKKAEAKIPATFVSSGLWPQVFNILNQKKLVYTFAAFLVMILGMAGYMGFATVTTSPEVAVKNGVETLKEKSQGLASAVISKEPKNISVAVKEVQKATKKLTDSITKNPDTVKEIAKEVKNNQTYLDIVASGTNASDLKESADILYKTIDTQMIADLQAATLTDSQKKMLDEAKELYNQGKYSEALEKILLINN